MLKASEPICALELIRSHFHTPIETRFFRVATGQQLYRADFFVNAPETVPTRPPIPQLAGSREDHGLD
jgi:hypothetical protein